MEQNHDITQRLRQVFQIEALEHIDVLATGFLALEKSEEVEDLGLIEKLSREAHTFKGAARTVNQPAIETVCRALEGLFTTWKKHPVHRDAQLFDLLHQALGLIESCLAGDVQDEAIASVADRITGLESAAKLRPVRPVDTAANSAVRQSVHSPMGLDYAEQGSDVVKVPSYQMEQLLGESDELASHHNALQESVSELRGLCAGFHALLVDMKGERVSEFSIGEPLEAHQPLQIVNYATALGNAENRHDELWEWTSLKFRDVNSRLESAIDRLRQHTFGLGTSLQRHQNTLKLASMEPFSELSEHLHRIVRDVSRDLGKEVELQVDGSGIHMDRRMLSALRIPLLHLIRNAVDHGIETPAERLSKGKPPRGHISITLARADNARFEIRVADDGAGIDSDAIKDAIVEREIMTRERANALSSRELLDLIFSSGATTRHEITDISGRGLGLAIVRESVERLAGQVWVESVPGKSTVFHMVLPSAVATLRGVVVTAGDREFIVPTAFVDGVVHCTSDQVETVENHPTIIYHGQAVSIVNLADFLSVPRTRNGSTNGHLLVVVVRFAERRVGLTVDRVVDEREVIVKSLGPQLTRVPGIAGATISGQGHVIPIVNISDILIEKRISPTETRIQNQWEERHPRALRSVLVVEDSITARTLLKNVLESAGFVVKTAIDGAEAYSLLKTEHFDLVISDIDMPRLNGIELVKKIRSDAVLHGIPVVLVSALESREDKERGIEAGANAYIVKSRFDSMNLIDTIRKLI